LSSSHVLHHHKGARGERKKERKKDRENKKEREKEDMKTKDNIFEEITPRFPF
jgi:hypothetical protein